MENVHHVECKMASGAGYYVMLCSCVNCYVGMRNSCLPPSKSLDTETLNGNYVHTGNKQPQMATSQVTDTRSRMFYPRKRNCRESWVHRFLNGKNTGPTQCSTDQNVTSTPRGTSITRRRLVKKIRIELNELKYFIEDDASSGYWMVELNLKMLVYIPRNTTRSDSPMAGTLMQISLKISWILSC